MRTLFLAAAVCTIFTLATACTRSRTDMIRDHAAIVEQKLESQRDRVLSGGDAPTTKDQQLSHLQALRMGLSVARVSLASIPLLLKDDVQREIGYSVLDEALGTIDWNIPIYQQGLGNARAYPSLFSPQMGLDFAAIQSGAKPSELSPNNGIRPPGIAR